MFINRIEKLKKTMKDEKIDQFIISNQSSIFYLLGEDIDPGERFQVLLINQSGEINLFINKLFNLKNDLDININWYDDTDNIIEIFSKKINDNSVLGVEKEWPAGFLLDLLSYKPNIKAKNSSKVINSIRMFKDNIEADLMRKASKINDKAMESLFEKLKENKSELELSNDLLNIYLDKGGDGFSFEPLICYGPACAEPHHKSDHSKLDSNNSVIIDIGCLKDGYCSDMTRSFYFGNPPEEYKKIYNLVLEANKAAIEKVKPGVLLSEIDLAGRNVIENEGYGEYFTHRIGHNIGIEVHEYPDVSHTSDIEAKEGMVFSIEPGIYIPGKYGVRIEDLVLVTKDGCEVLNNYPKELKCFNEIK